MSEVALEAVAHLLIDPGELNGGNVVQEFCNRAYDVRREGLVECQELQEIWDHANLARRFNLCERLDPTISATHAIRDRSPFEQRVHEPIDLV